MDSNELVLQAKSLGISTVQSEKIISRLPEYHRTSAIIGHSTSQTSYSLQTLQMLSDSPFSRLKQCLAQINKRYDALREAHFKIENLKADNAELQRKSDAKSKIQLDDNLTIIPIIEKNMRTAFLQMGMFQDMYDQICKNNNIPKNWSEKDYESQEISHMIKSSFRLAIQDLTATGRVGKACVEYWEQLGIHPQMGEHRTREYMVNTQKILAQTKEITINLMYDFMDDMVHEFKDSYKLALKRIGLNEIGSEAFMSEGATK